MNRYEVKTSWTYDAIRDEHVGKSSVIESATGKYVLYDDAKRALDDLRAELEAQIPEKRIARLEKALGLVQEGRCAECEQHVNGYKSPSGSFAPEAWATLRECGIDPSTGHLQACSKARI